MDTMPKANTKREDLRVKKTKKLIRNAVASLLKEKDVSDITVKEVAETADINRKTFYNYYSNVGQVVGEIENEVVDTLDAVMQDSDLETVLQNPTYVFENLISVLNRDPELYGNFLQMNGNVSLVSKMADEIKKRARNIYAGQTTLTGERLDVILEYMFNGMFSAFRRWFNSDQSLSLEQVSSDLGIVSVRGISGFVKSR